MRHLVAGQREGLLYRPFEVMLRGLDRRALRGVDFDISFAHLDRREVGRCLHKSRHLFAHGDHAVRTFAEGHDKAIRLLVRDEEFRHVGRLELKAHVFLYLAEHPFHLCYEMVPFDTYLLLEGHRNNEYGLCFAGNGVAEVAALDRRQMQFRLRPYTRQEPHEQLIRVRTTFVNIIARVTTKQSRHRETDRYL